jgi:hypothetical protein
MIRLQDAKSGPRTVYLSAPAIAVFSALPRVSKNPFVIVGDREQQHLVNLRKVAANLQDCEAQRSAPA